MVDTTVIATRLKKLDEYQRPLRQLQKVSPEEYLADDNLQTIVERKMQLSIQVCIDIANYVIAALGLRAPDELENVFEILGQEGVLSTDLGQRMVGMVQFRNILVHDYLDINPRIVHDNLTQGLADFDQFSQEIIARFLPQSP